ncbi:uncharacterized protein N7529_011590 [Penicillium soppii]|uniref:uncharacterized protein n=1 Tax=Penicillium soppii TaxID=69789 RepID=UPI0025475DE9|nr:uncharacterized protein N7529_011590 [Penicillium soppii]KAJ5852205.1 hypothetical protein N7529_011590 [Penicillium soppii]
MGLIKTGITLAGTFGLIKAAEKAVNNYEDKKKQRTSQSQPPCDLRPQTNYRPNLSDLPNGCYQHKSFEMPANEHTHTSQAQFNQLQSPPGYYQSQMPNEYQPQVNYAPNMNSPPPY